jgi:hypothetical protein
LRWILARRVSSTPFVSIVDEVTSSSFPTLPDSTIARQAQALLQMSSPLHLVHHCLRSYHWAVALAEIDRITYDDELLFVSAALHDLGLLEEFDTGRAFEEDGGRIASTMARHHGWPDPRADKVAEAIELHVAAEVTPDHGAEAFLLWHATGIDVAGGRVEELSPSLVRETLRAHPRDDFQIGFGELFERQARLKPHSRAGELTGAGLLARMAECPLDRVDVTP